MPNGTKSPMIASAAADISSSSGSRTQIADVARCPRSRSSSQNGRAVGEPLVEPAADRALVVVHVRAGRAVVGRRDVGSDAPTARVGRAAADPSAPSTVRISVSPTCAITRAWLIWCPRTTSSRVELEHRRRRRVREVLRGRPDARPARDLLHHLDRARRGRSRRTARRVPEVSPGTIGIRHLFGSLVALEPEERQRIHRRRTLPDRRALRHRRHSSTSGVLK